MMSRRTIYIFCTLLLVSLICIGTLSSVDLSSAQAQRTPRPTRTSLSITLTPVNRNAVAQTSTALYSKFGGTATAFAATSTAFWSKATRLPGDEAAQAISTYATEVLGTSVTVTAAGGATYDVSRTLSQTEESADAQAYAVKLAVETYAATLKGGAASLSYGKGTVTGDITIDVQASSLGVYTLYVTATGTLTADSALALATKTFPALANLPYEPYTVSKGFAWYTRASVPAIDPKTRQVTSTAQSVILYVTPGSKGQAVVTATVGRGDYASAIQEP